MMGYTPLLILSDIVFSIKTNFNNNYEKRNNKKTTFVIIKLTVPCNHKNIIIKACITKIKNLLKQERTFEILSFIFLLLAFAYSLWRALTLSITHDEAITSIYHASLPLKDIIAYNGKILSNNHLLNTLLVKCSIYLFGLSETAVRLPSLLGHIIYLTGLYKLLKLFLKKSLLLAGVVLLSFNPYLLDFFSLARGYALALGCLALGLYFFFSWTKNIESQNQVKNIWLAFLLLSLSALANISFLNVFLAVTATFFFFQLYKYITEKKSAVSFNAAIKNIFNNYTPLILSSIFLFLILAGPINKMKRVGELYFGGNNGFWSDTISSLIKKIIYSHNYFSSNLEMIIKTFIILIIVLFIIYIVKKICKNKTFDQSDQELTLAGLLIFFTAAFIILQRLLLNTLYVMERTAIYGIFLFFIFFLLLWKNLINQKKIASKIINYVFSAATLLLILHFALNLNLNYVLDWKYDANTKQVMEKIILASKNNGLNQEPLSIGVNWLFEPSVNFYIFKYRAYWLTPVNRDGPTAKNFNFYYLLDQDKTLIKKNKLDLINYYNISDSYLAAPPKYAAMLAKETNNQTVFSNSLTTDQPELFYTINLTPGIKLGRLTITTAAGLFLIVAISIIFLFFHFKKKLGEKKYQAILLSLIIAAWLPLYINFTYNNLYDLSENFKTLKYNDSSKRILRMCDIDNRQNLGGAYCRLFSFFTFIKNNLPAGSEVQLLTSPEIDTYFNYYLYPDYKIVDQADYLLFYRPNNYMFKNNILYKREGEKNLIIGKYKMIFSKSDIEFILKKL